VVQCDAATKDMRDRWVSDCLTFSYQP